MKLHEVRQKKAAKVAEARTLLNTAEGEKRSLNAAEQAAFDVLKTTITDLEGQEQRAQFVEDAERRTAGEPVDKSRTDLEGRISIVEAIAAHAENRSLTGALAEYNQEQKRQGVQAKGVLVPHTLFEQRAAQTTTTAAGIVPEDFRADQFVGLLRNSMVVRSLGARVLPNLRGDVTIPRMATTSTAQWLAEGDALTDSGLTFNSIGLKPKHVGAITELSRQLLQQSNPSIEALVRQDFVDVVSLAIDKALIHGDGVKEPEGLLTAATGTGTLATLSWATVLTVLQGLALKNITPNAWLTHPKVATILRKTLREAGLPGYLLDNGQLAGVPVSVTNQLAEKAGAPATGRMVLGDFSEMIVGTWGSVDVLTNQWAEGPYSRGAIQVRILTTCDMVPRREDAFTVIDDIAL
ncbi:phage major capsid protein [Acidovorax carolinensis]|uniref:phage major capsid protein n=1 Tax=Acidovorax carolinensis TaxID=553814 RepID=UPI000B600AD3|nr:phage major capsid protein [Acidovorax carolinensis]ART54826.1 phage major capsid protein [Acidovorax carolinensis]